MVQTQTQEMEAKLDALLMFEADHRTVEERFAILDESITRLEMRLSERVEQVEVRLDHEQQVCSKPSRNSNHGRLSDNNDASVNRRCQGFEQWRRIELLLF